MHARENAFLYCFCITFSFFFALMCLEKNLCLTLDHRFAVG